MVNRNHYYQCSFGRAPSGGLSKACDWHYASPVELSDFPWCPSEAHTRQSDFVEDRSTSIPRHIKNGGLKKATEKSYKKRGGNWT
jgi:hypothetical protein